VRPFAGLRYRRKDLSEVLAPPYDVITPEEQERLHQRDPHNAARLELGYGATGDTGPDSRYERAARTLDLWREEGVLGYDEEPCLYPYAQDFTLRDETRSRVGVLSAVRLTPFEEGVVLPHEGTLSGPREDRRRLMLACQAQISPVLALHDDRDGQIAALISGMMSGEPVAAAETDGERHRLWRRGRDQATARYCELLGRGPLYIADGHHRYETALTVSRELRQAHPEAGPDAAFNCVLMLLCPSQQPGVVILPTHRVLRLGAGAQWERLTANLQRRFQRQALECPTGRPLDAAQRLVEMLNQTDGATRFGIYTQAQGCSLLLVRPEFMPRQPGPGGIDELGTVLIHRLLIDPVLGSEAPASSVDYVMDEGEALRRVDDGRADCALFLRPTTVEQVKRVAAARLRMPGKSTYFYPKAPTGLVMSDISPGRAIPSRP